MTANGLLSISDFAKFSRITRDTLLYYDRIGLLSPTSRGENDYRYYSSRQLALVNVIRTLKRLGMTLDDIKDLKDRRTPELADEVFERQIEKIDQRIGEWIRARKLLLTLKQTINSVKSINEEDITIQFLPMEPLMLGEINDYSQGCSDYDALLNFYNKVSEKYPEMDLNYSVWATYSGERIKNGDWVWPDRYYFNNPEGPDKRPAALYAIGYTRGGYGQNDELYKRLLAYIDNNGFEVSGDAYEEYPLNEVCIAKDDNYLIRILITVCEKTRTKENAPQLT
ncbi:MAG: MerR family transcriptional regulator [Peptococcaceae bacterium]|nr:MerR family transcriptional regulator [Peptococcaceae bacterium]